MADEKEVSTLSVVDAPRRPATQASSEMNEALLALRSGAWLTVAGVLMLIGALVLNRLGEPSQVLGVPPAAWLMLTLVLVGQIAAAAHVELRRGWISRRFTPEAIYRYLYASSVVEGLFLAIGVYIVPESVVQLSLMTLVMVVFAGYFYLQWQAISFFVVATAANTAAVLLAPQPEPRLLLTPSALVPIAGVAFLAGAFVAVVRRGRDRVEQETRITAAVGLAGALDLRDPKTADHSGTVAGYAADMARELGLPPHRVERIRLAGLVHDVGKIGIPDAVLLKPGKLTDEEWELMRRHPELGAQMLDSTTLRDVRRWVLAHHERPDGRGYPAGLADDEIPLEARILSVADAFEAMTADRVYRAGMGVTAAIAELRRCSGSQFDGAVVDAFVRTLPQPAGGHPGGHPRPALAAGLHS